MSISPAPAKKILVVDDDPEFCNSLEAILKRAGHEVRVADGMKSAQKAFCFEEVDLVISDIRMPDGTGIQLLHWIKATRPVPVLLMTGFAEIAETREAAEFGAAGFLAKPFRREELLRLIDQTLGITAREPEPADLDGQYSKICIEDFVYGREMQYDIDVRMSAAKYVKIAHSGEDISPDRINSYKQKNITHLYMRREDFRSYVSFNLKLTARLKGAPQIAQEKKITHVRSTSEAVLQSLYCEKMDRAAYEQAGVLVVNAVEILGDSTEGADLLAALSSHSDHVYAHSVAVSLYSSMIARKLGWKSPATIFKLSMGGLLHDVGKKEIPREILDKPRVALTADEIQLLESHVSRGAELLAAVDGLPSDIVHITHQHHENNLGTGYPSHLSRMKIHPLAKIVAVADEFCKFVVKNPNMAEPLNPVDAFVRMEFLHAGYFDANAVEALRAVFDLKQEEKAAS